MSRLIKIADWSGQKRGNVVFVHGLGGHPFDTWRHSPDSDTFWPLWLAEDVPGLAVYSLGYISPPTNWIGTAMPLLDEAAHTLRILLNSEDLTTGPIIFICHSLGGLIVKQVLRSGNEQRASPEVDAFFSRVQQVVFIATPHTGSGKATLIERLGFIAWGSDSARDLVANKSELRDLNFGYRELAKNRIGHLAHRSYYEMVDTLFGRIVNPDSADPGLPNCLPSPIREDHITIAKPRRRDELVYAETRKFVSLLEEPASPGQLRTYPLEPFKVDWSWRQLLPKFLRLATAALLVLGIWKGAPPTWEAIHAIFETREDVRDLKDLVAQLLAKSAQASPSQERAVGKAVKDAQQGAQGGDIRLQQALSLLNDDKIAEAERLFDVVANEKAAQARLDSKDAAAAFRNLGAIAGLRDPKRALEAYTRALEFDPDDSEALYWAGTLNLQAGHLVEAEKSLDHLLTVSTKAGDQRGIYRAHLRLCELAQKRGSLREAMEHATVANSLAESAVDAYPTDIEWQRDLSVAKEKIGSVMLLRGDLAAALENFKAELAISTRLAQSNPKDTASQRDQAISLIDVGDVFREQREFSAAMESYSTALGIVDRLAQAEPAHVHLQRDVANAQDRIALILYRQTDLAGAMEISKASLAIRERLTEADPENVGWQRDLSTLRTTMGNILLQQGEIVDAMENYREALRIADRLANLDPKDADLQDDLSVSLENVGNILEIQGDHAGAIANYKASLAIRERLAILDPDQARWLRFLLTTHLALANSGEDPKLHFTKALELAVELERTDRLEVGDSRLPELIRQKLEAL